MLNVLMQRVRAASLLLGLGLAGALVPACSKSTPSTILQDKDFQKPEGFDGEFDRNNILEDANFTDAEGLDIVLVRKFLHKTPYDRPSFLETYQSNGIQAADAITRAARTYRLNPLVFLVYAETVQGLVGAQDYPFPPNRVEYVFGCGCLAADNCLPALAGFDRQVDCLGRALRKSLDDAAANGTTNGGWGKDVPMSTLDGLKVTPGGNATAAIYDRTPIVAEGQAGGTWLFWNVWQVYAFGIDYAGPIGGANGGGWVGDACKANEACGFQGATCATNYPDGLCTTSCTGDCPTAANEAETFCVDFKTEGGFCFAVCNPGAPSCRDGYKCVNLPKYKSTNANDAKHVCFPDTQKP
jgi:hypothetical protein